MKKILFFDTETNGIQSYKNKSDKTIHGVNPIHYQPHILEFAGFLADVDLSNGNYTRGKEWNDRFKPGSGYAFDENGVVIRDKNNDPEIIDMVSIPKGASDVNGLTIDLLLDKPLFEGDYMKDVFAHFDTADYIVGHNVTYDFDLVTFQLVRVFIKSGLPETESWVRSIRIMGKYRAKMLDTMHSSTDLCQIRNNWGGYKWPKLTELHTKLFGENFDNAHSALADIDATARCFIELVKRGIIIL